MRVAGESQRQEGLVPTHLKAGDSAPEFTLTSHTGDKVSLSDFKDKKNVVLTFYVLSWTGV